MDVEKTMQFILDSQAQHAVAMQQFDERMAQHDERLARLEASVAQLEASGP